MMFNQTQKVFKAGTMAVDIGGNGRPAMDLLVRELEQLTPAQVAGGNNYPTLTNQFFAEVEDPGSFLPLVQELPGASALRTNIIQHFFFLSRLNQDWIGTGFAVVPDDAQSVAGPLYRFSWTNRYSPMSLSWQFRQALGRPVADIRTNFSRIAEGVVHLRLRTFDPHGVPLISGIQQNGNLFPVLPFGSSTWVNNATGQVRTASGKVLDEVDCYFWNNAVPASLELELGILEPKVFQRYRAIGAGTTAATAYLSNHVAQVHLFRQRIPIRNVDFSAYQ